MECTENQDLSLKKKHTYYAQVKGQLAFTGKDWCDFVVHTCNGFCVQRITFDKTYFDNIRQRVHLFYLQHIIPEMYTSKVKCDIEGKNAIENRITAVEVDGTDTYSYFCPVCNTIIKEIENIRNFRDKSICCDKCELWFHSKCVKLNQSLVSKLKTWICPRCS